MDPTLKESYSEAGEAPRVKQGRTIYKDFSWYGGTNVKIGCTDPDHTGAFSVIEPADRLFAHISCPRQQDYDSFAERILLATHGIILKEPIEKKEADFMPEYVSKDAFEAHMRRIDDNVTSIKEIFIDRISAMEERMSHRTSSMENELKRYTTELRIRDEERKRELDMLYEMVNSSTEVTKSENKQTRWTMIGLTFAVLAAILAAMIPLGYQFFVFLKK
ncbi:MAG: hypothetical protein EOM15_13560 [Spirochaetia bacterium]|nr:hypothetical protein [Spirochaetia bacterium]